MSLRHNKLNQSGKFKQARGVLGNVEQQIKESAGTPQLSLFSFKGDTLEILDQFDEALMTYHQGLKLYPGNETLLEAKKQCYSKLKDLPFDERPHYSWQEIFEKDEDLRCEPLERCVLVRGLPSDATERSLLHYIQLIIQSDEKVNRILQMNDGVLVQFSDIAAADAVLEKKNHMFGCEPLRMWRKTIPPLYKDRFIITGKFQHANHLKTLLEPYDENSLFQVEKFTDHNSYLVTFLTKLDIEELRHFVSNLSLEVTPEVRDAIRTDCILVKNLHQDFTGDLVEESFASEVKSHGGDVTHVEINASLKKAFVYFASYKDAESVALKFVNNKFKIKHVEVSLFLHFGNKSLTKQKSRESCGSFSGQQIAKFYYVPNKDNDILDFIQMSPNIFTELKQQLENFANVEFTKYHLVNFKEPQCVVWFYPVSKNKKNKGFHKDHIKFENECKRILNSFLDRFCTHHVKINEEVIDRIREAYSWRKENGVILLDICDVQKCDVFVRWNFPDSGVAKLSGSPANVTKGIEWLHYKSNCTTVTINHSEVEYQILKEFGFLQETLEKFEDKVTFENLEDNRITFKGPVNDVNSVIAEVKKMLHNVTKGKLPLEKKLQLLKNLVEKNEDILKSHFQPVFRRENIKAVICSSPEVERLQIYYHHADDLRRAVEVINAAIITRNLQVVHGYEDLLKSNKWKRLEEGLQLKDIVLNKDATASSFILIGLAQPVNDAYITIVSHFEENLLESRIVNLSYTFATFLVQFPLESNSNVALRNVTWKKTEENGGGILLQGHCSDVTSAEAWLLEENVSYFTIKETVRKPGMEKYFNSQSGKDFLLSTQTRTKCVITTKLFCEEDENDKYKVKAKHDFNDNQTTEQKNSDSRPKTTKAVTFIDKFVEFLKRFHHKPNKNNIRPSTFREYVRNSAAAVDQETVCSDKNTSAENQRSESGNGKAVIHSSDDSKQRIEKEEENVEQSMLCDTTEKDENFSPELLLRKGDISEVTADVIVIATFAWSFASAFKPVISKVILEKAGKNLQAEYEKIIETEELKVGSVIATSGYKLNCKEIYHILLEKYGVNEAGNNALPDAIGRCLTKAATDGYSSIAFPALGVGGMKYPATTVANWMKDNIESFKSSTLRRVYLILFPTAETVISAFTSVFIDQPISIYEERNQEIESVLTGSESGNSPLPLDVSARTGDILESQCDIILYPTTPDFNLSGGDVSSNRLIVMAGDTVIEECQSNPIHSTELCRITNGGKLHCKYIALFHYSRTQNEFSQVLDTVLQTIDNNLNVTSVAIPAIDDKELNKASICKSMKTALKAFQSSHPQRVKQIEVISLDAEMATIFGSASLTHRPTLLGAQLSLIPTEGELTPADNVQVYLCSNNEHSIEQAWKRICEKVQEKSIKKKINFCGLNLKREHEEEILEQEKIFQVSIERTNSDWLSMELIVMGLSNDVMKASDSIQEYKEALVCAEYVKWMYVDNTNLLREFPVRTSLQLEKRFKKDGKDAFNVELFFGKEKQNSFVDFGKMTAKNLETNAVTLITHSLKSTGKSLNRFPRTWIDMDNKDFIKVEVPKTSLEYERIVSTFIASSGNMTPIKLERLQNPRLYQQFLGLKLYVEARMKKRGKLDSLPVTRQLFHGTTHDVCGFIYNQGFDNKHCGKNATLYGKGVYFATSCNYSQRYAQPDNKSHCRMFLADVITGEFHLGKKDLRFPDLIDEENTTDRYDSVVDNMKSPDMFVVFKDASAYPSYMLTFL